MNGSNTVSAIAGGTIAVNYVASPLNNCSYISSDDTTGVSSKRTISFTPSLPVIAGSALVINLPPGFSNYPALRRAKTAAPHSHAREYRQIWRNAEC